MSKITIKEYQDFTPTVFVVKPENALNYLITGLAAEAGEVAGVYAKYLRGDYGGEEVALKLSKEMGDCFYFLFQLANQLGLEVGDILQANEDKLKDRLIRGVLKGNGDDR